MKIWIDLTNSPHINFFAPFIRKWESEGHEVILTARDLANTIQLIKQMGWKFDEIGGHAGKNKIKKTLKFPMRIYSLYKFLRNKKIDVGISHSSFYSPLVCTLLKIPSIYLNDNEHAKGNYIAFKFASINILPEFLKDFVEQHNWDKKFSIIYYPGIKEGIYLSQKKIILSSKNSKIFIRPEPWSAEYYDGKIDFVAPFVKELSLKYEVVVLPRSSNQINYFKKLKIENVTINEKTISLDQIVNDCSLFIGAGGSMTRELAYLGVPTLSIYQSDLLAVDQHLVKVGAMVHNKKPNISDVDKLINKKIIKNKNLLQNKGKLAFKLINKKLKDLV